MVSPNHRILSVSEYTSVNTTSDKLPKRTLAQWRTLGRKRWEFLKKEMDPCYRQWAEDFKENSNVPIYKTDKELTLASVLFLIEDYKHGHSGDVLPVARTNCDLSPLQRKETVDEPRKNERILFWRIFDELDHVHRDYIWDVKGDSEFRIIYAAHLFIHNVLYPNQNGVLIHVPLPKNYLDDGGNDNAEVVEANTGIEADQVVKGLPIKLEDDNDDLYDA